MKHFTTESIMEECGIRNKSITVTIPDDSVSVMHFATSGIQPILSTGYPYPIFSIRSHKSNLLSHVFDLYNQFSKKEEIDWNDNWLGQQAGEIDRAFKEEKAREQEAGFKALADLLGDSSMFTISDSLYGSYFKDPVPEPTEKVEVVKTNQKRPVLPKHLERRITYKNTQRMHSR